MDSDAPLNASPATGDALLVFPPGWTPFAPYMALPALAGYLRAQGFKIALRDLNVEYYDHILSGPYLLNALRSTEEELGRCTSWQRRRALTAAVAYGHLAGEVEGLKQALRDRESVFAATDHRFLFERLAQALVLAATPTPGYSIQLNRFDLPFDTSSLEQTNDALIDRTRNPFVDYFERLLVTDFSGGVPPLVGISITSEVQLIPGLTLAKALREKFGQELHICLGGNFLSRYLRLIKRVPPMLELADSFVLGEGEKSAEHLLAAVLSGSSYANLPGVALVRRGEFVSNPSQDVDINSLPTPDYDGMPLDRYLSPRLILPVYTSRSCFAKCTFCAIHAVSGSAFRLRRETLVANDMRSLAAKHSTRYFTFVDETLAPAVLRRLSDELISTGLCGDRAYHWYGETRFAPAFTEDLARKMADAGCRKLQFGLESYNQRVLDKMKKGVKVHHILPNIEALLASGIAVHMFFMVGFPTETEEEARATDRFTRQVIKMSREVYGNPFTTRGFDVFNLDPLAPAYRDLDYHRLEIEEPDEGSVYFDVPYRAREGLQPEDARNLVAEFRSGVVPLLRTAPRLPPTAGLVEDSEEINFLGASWLSEARITREAYRLVDNTVFAPKASSLSPDIVLFDIPGLLQRQEPAAPPDTITMYSTRSSMWLELDRDAYRRLTSGLEVAGVLALKLRRWGFTEKGKEEDFRGRVTVDESYPAFFPDECHSVQTNETGDVSMLLHASGRVAKVSALMYLALRYCDGSRSIGEVFDKIRSTVPRARSISYEGMLGEFSELSQHGFLAFSDRPVGAVPILKGA